MEPAGPPVPVQNTIHQIGPYVPRRRRRTARPRPPPIRQNVYQLDHSFHPPIHPARPPPVDEAKLLKCLQERCRVGHEPELQKESEGKKRPAEQAGNSRKRQKTAGI
ncbi:hypothetical protein B0H16DRAFT_1723645 [Mycena metata]|uniref:Uncharacterized protein n=1 Tax=Mycena metata TaxID=1033252 RepID=A0AAD7IX02_9AGAR|nr:hypothetical protein B0H16DRAFT_1723645 [Mycena metata]